MNRSAAGNGDFLPNFFQSAASSGASTCERMKINAARIGCVNFKRRSLSIYSKRDITLLVLWFACVKILEIAC